MFRITSWIRTRSTASGVVLALAAGGPGWCQSPPAIPQPPLAQPQLVQPQPAIAPLPPPAVVETSTLPLGPIAEPQRVAPGDGRPVSVNLFEQERGSFDQVKERQQVAPANATQLRGTAQPAAQAGLPQAVADADLLRQAGIIIGNRNPGRMVIERVMPNSAAFAAGLHSGDVIARVYRGPVAPVATAGQTAPVAAAIIPIDVERNGRTSRVTLNVGPPALRTATRPDVIVSDSVIVPVPIPGPIVATPRATIAPDSGSTTGPGVSGNGGEPQGPGTPGLGSAPSEGGGSAAMRTGRFAPVKPGLGPGRPY